jgi:hypothetical protein
VGIQTSEIINTKVVIMSGPQSLVTPIFYIIMEQTRSVWSRLTEEQSIQNEITETVEGKVIKKKASF